MLDLEHRALQPSLGALWRLLWSAASAHGSSGGSSMQGLRVAVAAAEKLLIAYS